MNRNIMGIFVSFMLLFSVLHVNVNAQTTPLPDDSSLKLINGANVPASNTPTPTTYVLFIKVINEEKIPVPNAKVKISEMEDAPEALHVTNADGTTEWNSITLPKVKIIVEADGFLPVENKQNLKTGKVNEVNISLKNNPFILHADSVCAPGEKLLYFNDFQESNAEGWPEIELMAPGWSIGPDPSEPANIVLSAKKGAPWVFYKKEDVKYDNVVWRLLYKYEGNAFTHLNFRFTESASMNARYMYVGGVFSQLQRIQSESTIDLANFPRITAKKWQSLEMGYYDGILTIFLNGKKIIEYKDPKPWDGGTINLEPYPKDDKATIYYDNISVCEISAPLQATATPTRTPKVTPTSKPTKTPKATSTPAP